MSNPNTITTLIPKIRALIGDWDKSDFEVHTYDGINPIKLTHTNIVEVTRVLLNGTALGSASYDFDETTNELTLTVSALADGDLIQPEMTFNKYSDTELTEYIRSALVWLNVYSGEDDDYEIVSSDIDPIPVARIQDLICLITAILIIPDYNQYKLPTVTVTYTSRLPKEVKIERLVQKYFMGIGVNDVLSYDIVL